MSLSDRKKEYISKDRSLCEKNCEFIGYDEESEKAKCSCQVKQTLNLKEMIDKERLEDSFNLTKLFMNLPILGCYENAFELDLSSNYGIYPFLPIYLSLIISSFFLKRQISNLEYKIYNLAWVLFKKRELKIMKQNIL